MKMSHNRSLGDPYYTAFVANLLTSFLPSFLPCLLTCLLAYSLTYLLRYVKRKWLRFLDTLSPESKWLETLIAAKLAANKAASTGMRQVKALAKAEAKRRSDVNLGDTDEDEDNEMEEEEMVGEEMVEDTLDDIEDMESMRGGVTSLHPRHDGGESNVVANNRLVQALDDDSSEDETDSM
jgi:hypothetical protein